MRSRTIIGGSLLILVLLLGGLLTLRWSTHQDQHADRLLLYCAAGMQKPVQQTIEAYEAYYRQRHGRPITVEVEYAGSGTLLSRLQVANEGDLFLAADDAYITIGRERNLVREAIPVATMKPVIIVSDAMQQRITSLHDLIEGNYRVAIGVPDGTAIGQATRDALQQADLWEAFEKKVAVTKPTVNELAVDVRVGAADAAIVWDSIARQFDLPTVRDPILEKESAQVMIGVLSASEQSAAALHFARFLAAPEHGLKHFEQHHFTMVEGDRWKDVPEVNFFSGGVNRRALLPVIEAFEQREGVRVNAIFQGCGALNAQMATVHEQNPDHGFPDGYLACDVYYLEPVGDWFMEGQAVSSTRIVIVTARDNPHNIRSLEDLTRPGIRIVVGHPSHSTIGGLTERLFHVEGLHERIMPNIVERQPSSGMLVPPVVAGAADAALAYYTDTIPERDKLTVIELDTEYARAVQPYALSRTTRHPHLMRRLYQFIDDWREHYETLGFGWEKGRALTEFDIVAPAGARPWRPDVQERER